MFQTLKLLPSSIFYTFFCFFYCWIWTSKYLLDGHQIEITWHIMLIFLTLNIYSTIGIVLSRLTWNVIYSLAHNSVHSLAQGKNEGNETLGPWTPLMPFLLTSNKHVPTELVHTNEYLFQIRLHLIVLFSRSKFYTSELFSSEFFSPQTCFVFQTSFDLKFRHNPESKKSWKSKIRKDQLLPNTSFINIWKVIKPCIPYSFIQGVNNTSSKSIIKTVERHPWKYI